MLTVLSSVPPLVLTKSGAPTRNHTVCQALTHTQQRPVTLRPHGVLGGKARSEASRMQAWPVQEAPRAVCPSWSAGAEPSSVGTGLCPCRVVLLAAFPNLCPEMPGVHACDTHRVCSVCTRVFRDLSLYTPAHTQ